MKKMIDAIFILAFSFAILVAAQKTPEFVSKKKFNNFKDSLSSDNVLNLDSLKVADTLGIPKILLSLSDFDTLVTKNNQIILFPKSFHLIQKRDEIESDVVRRER